MRIGWYVTARGTGPRPWVLEKKFRNKHVIEFRYQNGEVRRWEFKEEAQAFADQQNRKEALS